jgi:hypothetical protein
MLGVSKQTVSRRTSQPEFKEKLSLYRKQSLESTSAKLVKASQKAVEVLYNLLASKNEMTRYSAASRILTLANDCIDRVEIVSRLDKLEQLQKEASNDD